MNRPCQCDRCVKGAPRRDGDCSRCWLYHHDAAYNRLWGGNGEVVPLPQIVTSIPPAARHVQPIAPPAERLKCRHLGKATGETARPVCGQCKPVPLYHCAYPGFEVCTPGEPTRNAHHRCVTCEQYEAPVEERPKHEWPRRLDQHNLCPGSPGLRFNPSIIAWQAGYLFAWRSGWAGSDIYLVRLDQQFQVIGSAVKLDLFHPRWANYGREDPRLFIFRGKLHVSYIGVEGHAGKVFRTSQMYASIDNGLRVDKVFYPDYPNRNSWEKNWQFFEHDGEMYAVYSIAPHKILHINGERASLAYETPTKAPWPGGEMRGGTAPVCVGDEFWCFFHDRIEANRLRVYRGGLYTFSGSPPFRAQRIVSAPVLEADPPSRPHDQYAAVIWPGGAIRRGNEWVLACGVHDRWSMLHRLDHSILESRLQWIAPPPAITLRAGSDDEPIFDSVALGDEYGARRLDPPLGSMDLVLDVGAHVGSFAWLALNLGVGGIVCVEPQADSVALLRRNLAAWGEQARIFNTALWHVDGELEIALVIAPEHTGGWTATPDSPLSVRVPCRSLDSLIEEVAGDGPIRLLKTDCEGAEFPFLLTSKRLGQIQEIVGEYHLVPTANVPPRLDGFPEWTLPLLVNALTAAGFQVTTEPLQNGLGHFYARRKD